MSSVKAPKAPSFIPAFVPAWPFRAWPGLALAMLLPVMGCSALKPACAVIDIAHYACEYVTVEYVDEDGVVQRDRVSTHTLRAAALEARAKKDAREKAQDGPDLSAE